MRMHFILSAHNRVELTVGCLRRIRQTVSQAGLELGATLFDDGSSDGTAEAASHALPDVQVIRGDGSNFWARSMAIAESKALLTVPSPDWIVWINDDVALDESWLERALPCMLDRPRAVHVGAMRDPESLRVTYSGFRKRRGDHPLRFELVEPHPESSTPVDTFNGNLVLVPYGVAVDLGGIDGAFSHAMADLDYGLRCGRAGIEVLLMPGTFGLCGRNAFGSERSLYARWRLFTGVKGGGNFRSLRHFTRRHSGRRWPLYIGQTYFLWWARNCFQGLGRAMRSDNHG